MNGEVLKNQLLEEDKFERKWEEAREQAFENEDRDRREIIAIMEELRNGQ